MEALGRIRTTWERALAALLVLGLAALALPAGAAADGRQPRTRLTERQLLRLETRLLGPAHAAEHARQRKALRHPVRASRRRRLVMPAEGGPAEVGAWAGPPRPIVRQGAPDKSLPAVHAIMLRTGKVLMFGYPIGSDAPRVPRTPETFAVLWDPRTGGFEDVPPPVDPRTGRRANLWCSGASLLADGRVLITGGFMDYTESSSKGLNHTWTFDPVTRAWDRHENLGGGTDPYDATGGRWYPSQMLMPDGRTFIIQGLDEGGVAFNKTLEVFDPSKPHGDELDFMTAGGGQAELTSDIDGDFYPHTFWMPTGRGLVAGPDREDSWFLLPPAPLDFRLQQAANPLRQRTYGTGVLLPLNHDSAVGRVMQIGGSQHPNADGDPSNDVPEVPGSGWQGKRLPATATTEVYDEATDAWSEGASMRQGRGHHNTVLLPDGTMVTIGGGTGGTERWAYDPEHDEHNAEVFDGTRWRVGPAQAEDRAYHSVALLLPDASVLSAGDDAEARHGNPAPETDTYEIYKPRYFFTGGSETAFQRERPCVASAPGLAGYGRTIQVGSPDDDVDRAVLVSPGAATHAVDMNQRVVNLPARRRADGAGYDVATPVNANVALPGYHMLFLVDRAGRPSVATWIRLDAGAGAQAPVATGACGGGPAGAAPVAGGAPAVGGPTPVPSAGSRGGDHTPSRISATVLTTRLRALRRGGRLAVRVGLGEAGRAELTLALRRGRRTTLGRWRRGVRLTGRHTAVVSVTLTRAQRAPARRRAPQPHRGRHGRRRQPSPAHLLARAARVGATRPGVRRNPGRRRSC